MEGHRGGGGPAAEAELRAVLESWSLRDVPLTLELVSLLVPWRGTVCGDCRRLHAGRSGGVDWRTREKGAEDGAGAAGDGGSAVGRLREIRGYRIRAKLYRDPSVDDGSFGVPALSQLIRHAIPADRAAARAAAGPRCVCGDSPLDVVDCNGQQLVFPVSLADLGLGSRIVLTVKSVDERCQCGAGGRGSGGARSGRGGGPGGSRGAHRGIRRSGFRGRRSPHPLGKASEDGCSSERDGGSSGGESGVESGGASGCESGRSCGRSRGGSAGEISEKRDRSAAGGAGDCGNCERGRREGGERRRRRRPLFRFPDPMTFATSPESPEAEVVIPLFSQKGFFKQGRYLFPMIFNGCAGTPRGERVRRRTAAPKALAPGAPEPGAPEPGAPSAPLAPSVSSASSASLKPTVVAALSPAAVEAEAGEAAAAALPPPSAPPSSCSTSSFELIPSNAPPSQPSSTQSRSRCGSGGGSSARGFVLVRRAAFPATRRRCRQRAAVRRAIAGATWGFRLLDMNVRTWRDHLRRRVLALAGRAARLGGTSFIAVGLPAPAEPVFYCPPPPEGEKEFSVFEGAGSAASGAAGGRAAGGTASSGARAGAAGGGAARGGAGGAARSGAAAGGAAAVGGARAASGAGTAASGTAASGSELSAIFAAAAAEWAAIPSPLDTLGAAAAAPKNELLDWYLKTMRPPNALSVEAKAQILRSMCAAATAGPETAAPDVAPAPVSAAGASAFPTAVLLPPLAAANSRVAAAERLAAASAQISLPPRWQWWGARAAAGAEITVEKLQMEMREQAAFMEKERRRRIPMGEEDPFARRSGGGAGGGGAVGLVTAACAAGFASGSAGGFAAWQSRLDTLFASYLSHDCPSLLSPQHAAHSLIAISGFVDEADAAQREHFARLLETRAPPLRMPVILELLSEICRSPALQRLACVNLATADEAQVCAFVPQIVQALRTASAEIRTALLDSLFCRVSQAPRIACSLYWALQCEVSAGGSAGEGAGGGPAHTSRFARQSSQSSDGSAPHCSANALSSNTTSLFLHTHQQLLKVINKEESREALAILQQQRNLIFTFRYISAAVQMRNARAEKRSEILRDLVIKTAVVPRAAADAPQLDAVRGAAGILQRWQSAGAAAGAAAAGGSGGGAGAAGTGGGATLATGDAAVSAALLANRTNLIHVDPPIPMPIAPFASLLGVIPEESYVLRSSQYPLVFACKLLLSDGSTVVKKYMFKSQDDLRQDQWVMQVFRLADQILKGYGCDYKLTTYQIMPLSRNDGLVEMVPDAEALSSIKKNFATIRAYLNACNGPVISREMDKCIQQTFVSSCAASSIVTYLLGVGDRHLDNLMLLSSGQFFHVDFGFILGDDPRPYAAPQIKLCAEMLEALGGLNSESYTGFLLLCCQAFRCLRRHADVILSVFLLSVHSGMKSVARCQRAPYVLELNEPGRTVGAETSRSSESVHPMLRAVLGKARGSITATPFQSHEDGPNAAIVRAFFAEHAALRQVQERFHLNMTEIEAERTLLDIIAQCAGSLFPAVVDKLHEWSQYWK